MNTYRIYRSCKELPENWDVIVKHDVFLQSNYLMALEKAPPNNIQCFYLGVFKDGELIGVGLIQHVRLYLKDMFRLKAESCFKDVLKNNLAKLLKGHVLVLGNLTHTGQHAMYFNQKSITQIEFFEQVFKAFNELERLIKIQYNKKIHAVLLKDFFKNDQIHQAKHVFDSHKLHQVAVQPNMIMPILPNWKHMDDYVASLNSKYKTRYKRARKKRSGIRCEELHINAVESYSNQLHALYLNVCKNADFNTFVLPQNHFYQLKKELKDSFKVFGYYYHDELIGFFTLLCNNKSLETYFLGYDENHQYNNQLYLNMLYDMAKFGIENNFSSVIYARTAMEIKSSVGAKPEPMFMYLKHNNLVMNTLFKYIFRFMNPTQKWQERHPFLKD
ncbi:GNAT family N-acetyltransferase [Yeosuana aromativorans]|nr:GNAT family N-acetyltransferase [Yeosuana aromativorans]